MVVPDVYVISTVIELVIILIFGFFFVFKRGTTLAKAMRLATSSILLFINIFQLPTEAQLGMPYNMTILLTIFWFALAMITVVKFHQED